MLETILMADCPPDEGRAGEELRPASVASQRCQGSIKASVVDGPTEDTPEVHENRHGQVTISSRAFVENLIRLGVEDEPARLGPPPRKAKSSLRESSQLSAPGPTVDVEVRCTSRPWRRREADAQYIRAKVERYKERREERFQRLLKALNSRSELKEEITNLLQAHADLQEDRRYTVWKGWTDNVWEKIQRQCDHLLNRVDKNLETHFNGTKSVTFSITDEPMTASIDVSSDPTKWSLYDTAVENQFRRSSQLALSSIDPSTWSVHPMRSTMLDSAHSEKYATERPSEDHLRSLALPSVLDPLSRQRSVLRKHRSRPVLEPMDWGPVRLKCSAFRLGDVEAHIRPLRRMDGFINAADMQESAAGLRRTRDRHRDLGILIPGKPFVRNEGQSALYKDMVTSASCGAPCQGHFHFPTSKASVDREFPLGKKMWETPPGTVGKKGVEIVDAANYSSSSSSDEDGSTPTKLGASDEVDNTMVLVMACAAECPALSKHMTRITALEPVHQSLAEDAAHMKETDERRCQFHPMCLDCQDGADCPMATCFRDIAMCMPLRGFFGHIQAYCGCTAGVDFGSKPGEVLGAEYQEMLGEMQCPESVVALPARDSCYGPGEPSENGGDGSSDAYTLSATAAALLALVHFA
ncbi:hypothetical protein FOZ60_008240 [Perkinsus olseni]|uniref:Uncharacterized protein n=1 Tax=Perkinsus olseni TaxID=32597 RepID=A0A7J6PE23_PEROL|nr:hypothetical protein FOZ60_008240 [Perkinsus olseni]